MARWNLSGIPRITANRWGRAMDTLKKLVPPRISASVLRTIWNGWSTSRRFQAHSRCVFRCSDSASDSLEHYALCPLVHEFGRKCLNIGTAADCNDRGHFLMLCLNQRNLDKATLARRAIWIYAVYRAFLLYQRNYEEGDDVVETMKQFTRLGVRGHRRATSIYCSSFTYGQVNTV